MKKIIKKVRTVITTRTELKVPENTEECNNTSCDVCAYKGNYRNFCECPHRTVMDRLEAMEDES